MEKRVTFFHIQQFLDDGFVPIDLDQRLIEPVVQGYLSFLSQPEEVRRLWTFDHDLLNDPDCGHVLKDGGKRNDEQGVYDRKAFFHFRPSLFTKLRLRGVDYQPFAPWLQNCARLHHHCREAIKDLVTVFDSYAPDGCPRLSESFSLPETVDEDVLRVLVYRESRDDNQNVIAAPHTDRCGLTIALAESHSGLMSCITPPYRPLAPRPVLFAGQKLEQMTAGRLKAMHHGVKHPGGRFNEEAIRWAVVFFSHPFGVRLLPGQTHQSPPLE